jgi:hypothetical protein
VNTFQYIFMNCLFKCTLFTLFQIVVSILSFNALKTEVKAKVTLQLTVSQSAYLGVETFLPVHT